MSKKKIAFELITPEKVVFKGDLELFNGISEIGKFEILPGHADIIAALKKSQIEIKDSEGKFSKFNISGGILSMRRNKITVLTEKVS